ncbi:MAG: hypothetical protein MUF79_10125 [Burkholderiales bacterium]|jgi:hypothetical protein|nr:hypothetical protein [Burkholderiales bacterium]
MTDALDELRGRHERLEIPAIRVAFAISILLHLVLLIGFAPQLRVLPFEGPERGKSGGGLTVELAPSPPKSPAPQPQRASPQVAKPAPPREMPAPRALPKPSAAPPVLARRDPAPAPTVPPPPPTPSPVVPVPESAPSAAPTDLSSYIEARRRARSEPAPRLAEAPPQSPQRPEETERERHNREVAAKLGLDQSAAIGYDPKAGGGIFQIQYVGVDEAEFVFFGWNKDIRRNSRQLVKVKRGDNPDIRIAMVRKMIAIIRENVSGEFVWISQRLRRDVTLSARPADNAGLEDFLMQEFFADPRVAR